MFFRKEILIAMILFTVPLAAFDSISVEDREKFHEIYSKKHEITQENFDLAMEYLSISKRRAGRYLAGELTLKLEKFVGKKLSANEWYYEVKNAYDESLIKLGKEAASSIKRTYLIEAIAMGIIWPIPSKI